MRTAGTEKAAQSGGLYDKQDIPVFIAEYGGGIACNFMRRQTQLR
jgi:hypothetical protein